MRCCVLFPGTDLRGLFEEPCSVLAWRLRNPLMLIQHSVPGLGLFGQAKVCLHPIKTQMLSQHIGAAPLSTKGERAEEGNGERGHVLW